MTQDEVIKLAAEAGFKWPDICETTIEQRLGRFANLIAVAEREKCTGTQEFVTLPREVVERALEALSNTGTQRGKQPSQFLAEGLSINALRAALDQPQNHVPDAGNMAPAGWKLVPVEPTIMQMAAMGPAIRACYDMDGASGNVIDVYRAMLASAPHPPTTEDCSVVQPQGEQEPVGFVRQIDIEQIAKTPSDWGAMFGRAMGFNIVPVYTHPQPKRKPLTDERIDAIADAMPGGLEGFMNRWGWRQFARAVLEATNNIK